MRSGLVLNLELQFFPALSISLSLSLSFTVNSLNSVDSLSGKLHQYLVESVSNTKEEIKGKKIEKDRSAVDLSLFQLPAYEKPFRLLIERLDARSSSTGVR